ncbi:MAG: hypothetical protein GY809_29860, partial [Planctomycetes bacterium]|nr:hypothetical protein [Planctomycetota bacterium]
MNEVLCMLNQRIMACCLSARFRSRVMWQNTLVRRDRAMRRMLPVLLVAFIFVSWPLRPLLAADPVRLEQAREYQLLETQITHYNSPQCDRDYVDMVASQTYRDQARILDEDRDPTDVVLRRSVALFNHLWAVARSSDMTGQVVETGKQTPCRSAALETYGQRLTRLVNRCGLTPVQDFAARKALYFELAALRRQIAFTNPLLDFDEIVFLKKHRARYNHIVDQYFGARAVPGGGVFVLRNPLGDSPEVVNLLKDTVVTNGRFQGRPLPSGAYVTLDLDYGAQWIAFAFTEAKQTILTNTPLPNTTQWTPESTYHIFLAKSDGSEIRELTDGMWNDFDPCFLPNGRIAFISERRGGHDRCSQRPNPVFTLHDMARDGSDLSTLSYHETNEWNPSVGHDGMLLYTRWDYVDRAPNIAHHLWTAYPDGRDPRSLHGNYPGLIPNRAIAELAIRAIPGSPKMIAVAGPHHGQAYGSLVLIDLRTPDDNAMSQVRRITPEVPFPESEVA